MALPIIGPSARRDRFRLSRYCFCQAESNCTFASWSFHLLGFNSASLVASSELVFSSPLYSGSVVTQVSMSC